MVNCVILAGHCTQDTAGIATQGKPMARMRLATNSVWRDANGERREATEYHSIVLFGRISMVAQQYAVKGRAMYIESRLATLLNISVPPSACRSCNLAAIRPRRLERTTGRTRRREWPDA
jgi:hypothetical protein